MALFDSSFPDDTLALRSLLTSSDLYISPGLDLSHPVFQMETLIKAMTDGLTIFDRQGRVLLMNPVCQRFLARYLEPDFFNALLDERWKRLNVRDEQGRAFSATAWPIARLLRGEVLAGSDVSVLKLLTVDGAPIYLQLAGAPLRNERDELIGAIVISRDVTSHIETQQHKTELMRLLAEEKQALDARDQHLDLALETARLGSWQMDLSTWDICSATRGRVNFGRSIGYHIPFASVLERVLPDDRLKLQQALQQAIDQHVRFEVEYRIHWMDGSLHWVAITGQPLCTVDGQPYCAVGVAQDITRQKEVEQRRDDFLGMITHDLRTPLTSMKGYLQIARRQLQRVQANPGANLTEQLANIDTMLERAEHQVTTQTRFINDLLDVSRIMADTFEINLEELDLVGLVRDVVAEQQISNLARHFSVVCPTESSILVQADPARLRQVLSNYLTNALKYSPEATPVEVAMGLVADAVRVAVSDHGDGIPLIDQQRVWERFYQASGRSLQQGQSSGLGLGLSICQKIIHQHRGQVGVESNPGQGATFWFQLPRLLAKPGRF